MDDCITVVSAIIYGISRINRNCLKSGTIRKSVSINSLYRSWDIERLEGSTTFVFIKRWYIDKCVLKGRKVAKGCLWGGWDGEDLTFLTLFYSFWAVEIANSGVMAYILRRNMYGSLGNQFCWLPPNDWRVHRELTRLWCTLLSYWLGCVTWSASSRHLRCKRQMGVPWLIHLGRYRTLSIRLCAGP